MIKLLGNDISITKGDNGVIVFNFKDKCKPFNLDGYTVKFIIKKEKEAPDDTAILSQDLVSQQAKGNSVLVQLTNQFTNREPETFYYGVRIVTSDIVQTVLEGNFSIVQGVFQ